MTGFRRTLSDAYKSSDAAGAADIYTSWAATYDAETLRNGYQVPFLGAAFLARHAPPGAGMVLEAGCGTGLGGRTLATLGYGDIVGLDLTAEMLALAAATGVYSRLIRHDLADPIPLADGAAAATVCLGCFGPGHAPPGALRHLARVTAPGGVMVFNLREDTYAEQGFPQVMEAMTVEGLWSPVETSPAFRAFLLSEPDLLTRIFVCRVAD